MQLAQIAILPARQVGQSEGTPELDAGTTDKFRSSSEVQTHQVEHFFVCCRCMLAMALAASYRPGVRLALFSSRPQPVLVFLSPT